MKDNELFCLLNQWQFTHAVYTLDFSKMKHVQTYIVILNCSILALLKTKVLNPMEWGYPDFFIKQDMPPSHPVPTLKTRDVPRYPNWDASEMSYLDTWDGTPS